MRTEVLMMNTYDRLKTQELVSRIFKVIGWLSLICGFLFYILLPAIDLTKPIMLEHPGFWITAIVAGLFFYSSRLISELSEKTREEIELNLVGLLHIYGRMGLSELARKTGLREGEVIAWLAKLSLDRKFDYRIDKETREVILIEGEGRISATSNARSAAKRIREYLEKLKQLYETGEISETAYMKLREEYQKKLRYSS